MMEAQHGPWYGRILQRVELDPNLISVSGYWQNEWYPPKTVEARELIWLQGRTPTYEDLMQGVSWFIESFNRRPTAVYCDTLLNPRRFEGMDIYGPVVGVGRFAGEMGLTRR